MIHLPSRKWVPLFVSLAVLGILAVLKVSPPGGGTPAAPEQTAGPKTGREDTVPVVQRPGSAAAPQEREPLPDLDVRAGRKPGAAFDGEGRGLEALQQEIPGVAVEFDPVTKSPKWIGASTRLLTGPQEKLAAQDKDAPVREFINTHRELFGHGGDALAQARRVTDYTTARSPSRKVVWHQQHAGIDIFEAVLQANLTADAALINIGSQFLAEPQAAAAPAPALSVEEAVAAAGRNVGENMQAATVRATAPPAEQPDRRQPFRAALLTDADARLTWLPMDATTLRLAWDVTLTSRSRAEMFRVLVDAATGDVLVRHAMTAYISDATYRVFTTESPTPFSPGHETPSSLQPLPVGRVLVTTPALNTTASPNGWINDGGTITSGNNADAYTDVDNNNIADLPRTTGTNRVFDFPHDLTQDPATFKDASVTQLFYWTNFIHDRTYELGFTEAAGNFQTDNFGRGGAGNDPVNAEAQDGSGTNNANFSTPTDGGRGRMQMFNWTSPTPDRDGSFEAEVVLHEYAHGVSNRLVGGPSVTITALATRGMGEGWSDFYGLALTAEARDNPHANWARAGWSRYFTSNWLSENYYYGARRYSYSTDMTKNPHTFRDIDPNLVDWHVSVPRNPTYAATQDASQVHYVGTVWATTLWDMRANLILKHGFATGNERALFLVTEGMKLGPANPDFIQARDGILQATLVNHSADLGEVWTAFAKRGMGDGAVAPSSGTTTGVTEQYDVPDGLEVSDRSGWNITGTQGGAFLPAAKTLTLSNDSASPVSWTAAPNAPWLAVSPASGSLAAGANVTVTLTPQAASMPAGFHSTNVVFRNPATGFNQPVGVRLYVTPPAAHVFDLSTNPGWTTSGQWAYGTPGGGGGSAGGGAGNADPAAGFTGSQVFGVNLAGNAATTVGGPFYLTTAPVDLSARKATRLRFKRWLNSNTLTNARMTVQISTDGTTWRDLFVNAGSVITDNAWQTLDYDISSIADLQPAVQVRWGYQNLVSTTAYSGWNLDDIEFLGESMSQLTLDLPDAVAEGDAPLTATLTLSQPLASATTVTLTSSNPQAATVPPTLTLPAGQVSQTFTLTPVNDSALDGSETTLITATAPGIAPASHLLTVTDDETATLSLSAPASVGEGSTGHSASLTVSTPPTHAVTVQLSVSSPRLTLPASVTLPAGSTGPVTFSFDAPGNDLAEGTQDVTLTAAVTNWTSGTAAVSVTDDDTPAIALSGPAAVREGAAPVPCTVTVNTVQTADLVLSLSSSDVGELAVPSSITIPAGQFSVSFNATVVDDADFDGAQPVALTVSSAAHAQAVLHVLVGDNEVSGYSLAPIPSPQRRSTPFPVAVTVQDINGEPITDHTGSVTLSSASPGGAVAFTAPAAAFVNGVATFQVTVTNTATGMTLTATDGNGRAGTSNSFDVQPVTHAGFAFTVPATASPDTLFSASARAVDDLGNTYTGYAGSTVLEMLCSHTLRTVGSLLSSNTTPLVHNTAAHDSRIQIIYTAAEIGGGPQLLSNLALVKNAVGGQSMSNYNLRVKHTTLQNFEGRSWEEDGWTTVYTSSSFLASGSAHSFTRPFAYDGVRNLMVDISFDNTSASTPGLVYHSPAATSRVLAGTSNSTHGSPLTWTAATGPVPLLSKDVPVMTFYIARSLGQIPALPVTFANGTWSGQTQAPATAWLRATAPSGVQGISTVVLVAAAAAPVGTEAVFSDGFETGALAAPWSTADNSGATARTQVTTANTPKTGSYHLTLDTTSTITGTYATNRPTLTLNLAGRKNVSLEWYSKGFLEEPHLPPATAPLGLFDAASNYDGVAISQDGVTWVQAAGLTSLTSSYSTSITRVSLDPLIQRLGWSYNNTFRVRFSQYDDQAIPNDGIALDDIAVRANPTASINLSLPPTISEGTLSVPVTVTLPAAAAASTSVTLTSNAPGRLSIVSPVVIAAGQTTGNTTISAPQNAFADAGRGVIVTASATGQTTAYHHVRVVDDEQPVIVLTLPQSVTEGGSSGTGTVSLEPAQTQATLIYLASSDPGEATVGSYVTLSAGASVASFAIVPVNDTRLDGTQAVTLTAMGQGLVSASGTVDVLDNESAQITVTPPPTLVEGGAFGVGTVALAGPRSVETVVSLTSSDLTEATVPATVRIPAGQISVNFQAMPVEDSLQDGPQTVTITASAAGLLEGTASFVVRDDDPASFEWTVIPSPQTRNAPFTVVVTAKDDAENTVTGFNGTVALTAQAGADALPVTPATTPAFVNGVWTGEVSIGGTGSGVTLLATGGGGATGSSDAFDVVSGGAAVALLFDPVPSPQKAGVPVAVGVRAVDAAGVRVTEASGPVTVTLVTSPGGVVVATSGLTLVDGAATASFVVPAPLPAVRLQGTSGTLQGQGGVFAITSPSSQISAPPALLFEDGFEAPDFKPEWTITGTGTHRTVITTANAPRTGARHLTMDSTTSLSYARNEATLTLDLEGRTGVELSFWIKESGDEDNGPPTAPFTTGADFDGVAISADGINWYEVQGLRTADGIGSAYRQFSVNLEAAAAARGLTLNSSFKIRFNHYDDYPWGTDGFAFDDIQVRENVFLPPQPVQVLFADDFETGVFQPQWTITGTNNHRTEITAQQTPRGSFHLVMDTHTIGDSRNEATLALDTTGWRDVVMKFWMKENSDEDQAPPSNPFTGGADFDGVAVSVDGSTWHEVLALRDPASTNTYQEFTLDLDAALAARGLSHGPGLRIRLNHFDNYSWVGGDGFAFDDIVITGRPEQQVTLELPARVAEGGSVIGRVRIPAVNAAETVITLTASRPGSVSLPASVTIPAGGTVSADFTVAAIDDAFLTGSQKVQIIATTEGLRQGVADMEIQDNEPVPGFLLTVPATLAEGATITGNVSIGTTSLFALRVALAASPGLGLTLPASITIPAGGTSAPFTLAKAENQTILEPASTTLTATLGAATQAATVALGDNDSAAPLVITLPATVPEAAGPVTGSVGFAPPILCGTDLVVTLTSSNTAALGVPATVTLPAGSGSVPFQAAPQDNATTDGTRVVTVTAAAAGISAATRDISVLDDEVHHLSIEPVPSPQVGLQPFALTVRARSIDDQTLAGFNGTVTLAAANGGGSVPLTPTTTGAFAAGVWTGQVTFSNPAAGVVVTASSADGATGSSNAFDVTTGPRLWVAPASLNVTLPAGEPATTRDITLANPGTLPAAWSAEVAYTGLAGHRSLESVLERINTSHASITGLIPSRYDFSEGITGSSISDGGGDMYDSGNFLNTNLTSGLSYSDGVLLSHTGLGSGGRYFTRKQPGLFVFAAETAGLSHFEITGNLGADGSGSTNTTVLTATRGGVVFKGYVKRVFGTSDPSVNHLIIIQDNGTATHAASTDTDNDQHRLSGLAGVTRLYYLLYASQSGGQITDQQTQAIMEAFLDVAVGSSWLTLSATSGSVPAAGSATVQATLSPAGLAEVTYQGSVRFTSNDPVSPQQQIPATLTVTPAVASFQWGAVPSPQTSGLPFTTTITAKSAGGSTASSFNGRASITGQGPGGSTLSGTGTNLNSYPLYGSYYKNRVQAIYLPAEVGTARRIQSVALDVAAPSGALSNFTVRAKHTSKATYTGTGNAVWDSDGWTTVYSGTFSPLAVGLVELPLAVPFEYDGTSNLMLDFSFNNFSYVMSGSSRTTSTTASRVLYSAQDSSYGSPTTWSGTVPLPNTALWLPNVRFTGRPVLPTSPRSVDFVNGVWSGSVTVGSGHSQASLWAQSSSRPEVGGESNTFVVGSTGTLSISAPATGTEGTVLNATVTASAAPVSNLTVLLASSDPGQATVPASVIIPAGQTSATFSITLPPDGVLDGTQSATVSAMAAAYSFGSATVGVLDADTTTVTLTLPATLAESSSSTAGQATVSLGRAAAADLAISLASASSARLQVPATVVVPAGQTSAGFTLTAPNNSILDGDETILITATLPGSPAATGAVQVLDNEARTLSISLFYSSLSEGAAPVVIGGQVNLSGTVVSPLVINLSSSDTTELVLPASVTVSAGTSSSGYFSLTPVNDNDFDGSQTVSIVASAATYLNGTRTFTILDDDVHHFTLSAVGATQIANAPFSITATARDVNDVTISAYAGSPTVTVGGSAGPLPVTPAVLTGFSSGSKAQQVSVNGLAASAVITVTDPLNGSSGSTNAFALGNGPHSRFGWSNIDSPRVAGEPMPVTITAQDAYGNTVPSFTGTAVLSATSLASVGTGATTLTYPFYPYYDDVRTQVIYTAAEVGAARSITAISLDLQSLPSVAMSNFKIRLRHTPKADYAGTGNAVWETTDWTTCLQGTQTLSTTGWNTFFFTTPFVYDGVQNVMVDISFSNGQPTFVSGGSVRATAAPAARTLYFGTAYYTDPVTWSGTSPTPTSTTTRPDIRFSSPAAAPSPGVTGAFTAGVWTGSLTSAVIGSNVALHATSSGASGMSNLFTAINALTLSTALPASVVESAGAITGIVSISTARGTDLVVSLQTSDSTAVQFPSPTVIIPAGATFVGFTLNIINDSLQDGAQSPVITISAAGLPSSTATLLVMDDDLHHFSWGTMPDPTYSGSNFNVTVQARTIDDQPATAFDGSSAALTGFILGNATPVSPASTGAFSAGAWTGPVSLNGAGSVSLTATSGSITGSSVSFTQNLPTLQVTMPATAPESVGTVSGSIKLPAPTAAALTVSLTSNTPAEAQPASPTVTIAAGATMAIFTLNVQDDSLKDGSQNVVITATAPNVNSGTAVITITDDDVHNFVVSAIGPQVRNTPFSVTFTARDVNNAVITSYTGSPLLSAADGGITLTVQPGTLTGFFSGVKTQLVTVDGFATDAVLTVTDPASGGSGSSAAFAVTAGAPSRFVLGPVTPPQVAGVGFPLTVTAQDASGNTATSYTGSATLAATAGTATRTVGTASTTTPQPFNTIFTKCRNQQVHLAAEIGAAGTINGLGLQVTALPVVETLTDFTIRIKHTSRTGYGGISDLIWESSGFTTVYQSNVTLSTTGIVNFVFTTPFVYDGTSNLMIDFSYRAASNVSNRPTLAATTRGNIRAIKYYTSTTDYGEPLTWAGLTPNAFSESLIVDLRLEMQVLQPLTPPTTGAFVNGTWTGNVSIPAASPSVTITASSAPLSGSSNFFEVVSAALALAPEPAFTGGLSNVLSWNEPASSLEYEVERSTTADFTTPLSTGFLSGATTTSFTGLSDGQTYHYRARMRRPGTSAWTSGWSPVQSSTQDATPPVLGIPELTSTAVSATLGGTAVDAASGVSTVTVGGSTAGTSNAFATWTRGVTNLIDGSNSFTVLASDNAVPPNTVTATAVIYRITSPSGDPNHNGINSLLEHALGIPAAAANPRAMLPAATVQTDGGTGARYLTLQFRRRLNSAGLNYTVQTSTNLSTWDSTGSSLQVVSATPTGDGVTETVTVRVTPAIGTPGQKFVRLQVTTD